MFGIGMQELLIILVVALLILGPSKLPGVARSIGKGLRELRKASDDLRTAVMIEAEEEDRRRGVPKPEPLPARSEDERVPEPAIHGSLAATAGVPREPPSDETPVALRPADGAVARGEAAAGEGEADASERREVL